MMRFKWTGACAVVAVAATLALPVFVGASPSADPAQVVEDRQEFMKGLGAQSQVIQKFLQEGEGTIEDVVTAASTIAERAETIPTRFPEGTGMMDDVPRNGARPVIWQDWADFESRAANLASEARRLAEVAANGDRGAIAGQLRVMGQEGCGGCHQTYRERLD